MSGPPGLLGGGRSVGDGGKPPPQSGSKLPHSKLAWARIESSWENKNGGEQWRMRSEIRSVAGTNSRGLAGMWTGAAGRASDGGAEA